MTTPMIDLTGKIAIVTGGSSGVSLATAGLLLETGAAVTLCGHNTECLTQAERGLCSRPPDAQFFATTCDVFDAAQTAVFADAVEQAVGSVDMLVNNADQGRVSTLASTDNAAWTWELHLKFFSVIHPTRTLMLQLERSVHSVIVCVNSLLTQQSESRMVAISAVRAGVLNLVHSMAIGFILKGVCVNDILIGLMESGQ